MPATNKRLHIGKIAREAACPPTGGKQSHIFLILGDCFVIRHMADNTQFKLSARLDSNQRPPLPQSGALPGLRYAPFFT